MSAAQRVMDVKSTLEKMGHTVVIPKNIEKYADGTLDMENAHESTQNKIHGDLIRSYYNEIKNADCVLVVNEKKNGIDNYIGGNTLIEMSFAHIQNKENYILNDIPELSYKDEIIAMQPVILNGNLSKLK